ncbi:invasion associated locus B family protein [Qipengyuania sp. JC766]|uniref:invasion associated locus B family protein n=1 Tax=Qipengyuania sp. JC766 TaxID=3232139 RepID=UPI0034581DE8
MRRLAILLAVATLAVPASARESLGVFSDWGAFRDTETPRCYAIAKARPSRAARELEPFASVGTWPERKVRNQIHFRLSRAMRADATVSLRIGDRRFELTGARGNAWAKNRAMDAAIVAAMRSAGTMTVSTRDTRGRQFSNTYDLAGAATAMDAATVGCARL